MLEGCIYWMLMTVWYRVYVLNISYGVVTCLVQRPLQVSNCLRWFDLKLGGPANTELRAVAAFYSEYQPCVRALQATVKT